MWGEDSSSPKLNTSKGFLGNVKISSISNAIQETCLAQNNYENFQRKDQMNIYRSRLGRIVMSQSWKEVSRKYKSRENICKSKPIDRAAKDFWCSVE